MRRALPLIAALALAVLCGCSRKDEPSAKKTDYDFRPVLITRCYQALVEKPDARSVLLIGEPAVRCREIFEKAGTRVSCRPRAGEKFDLVCFGCDEITSNSLHRAMARLADDGVVAWFMDVRGQNAEALYASFAVFDCPVAHLWMSGEDQWLLAGRKVKQSVRLETMLELFARESAFDQLAELKGGSLPGLFAGYVGTLEDVLPAFGTRRRDDFVCPQNYIPKEIPTLPWISAAGVDDDIAKLALAEMRSMQVVRRVAVGGNIAAAQAKDKKGEERATDAWARAFLRNPADPFLLERIDRLGRNARGFLSVGKLLQAMKCFETIVLINPRDVAAVHNFGMCLKKIGKRDLAEKVLRRAELLEAMRDDESCAKDGAAETRTGSGERRFQN